VLRKNLSFAIKVVLQAASAQLPIPRSSPLLNPDHHLTRGEPTGGVMSRKRLISWLDIS